MSIGRLSVRATLVMATIAAASSLGGCSGGDGVELNGRIFDAMGISTSALGANRSEPQLAPRAPLVMPPTTARLPDPNAVPAPPEVAADQSWPADKDQQRVASAVDKKRQQDDYCRKGNWRERALDNDTGGMQGPQGACGSIFSFTQDLFGNGSSEK